MESMYRKGKVPLSTSWFHPAAPTMPSGLFAGKKLSALPLPYLRLTLGTADLPPDLREAIERELERRQTE
jgi:hypothetical protein